MWPNKRPFKRASKWDGVMPIQVGEELDQSISPEIIEAVASFIRAERGDLENYDLVAYGKSPANNRDTIKRLMERFIAAGATWWVEAIDPWHYGWTWEGDWPLKQMQERIEQGPPGI
jgi:hypothetical protein